MRVYNRIDFLHLPEGTIFAKGKEWYFDGLQVKGITFPAEEGYIGDFYSLDPSWIDSGDRDQFNLLDDMRDKGISAPMENSEIRDGLFEEDDLFLVFEKDDLIVLKDYLEKAIANCN